MFDKKEYMKAWYQANKEKSKRTKQKAYYEANKEKIKAIKKAYNEAIKKR